MNTLDKVSNPNLDSYDTDTWVLESCFLDLLVDEEKPEDIDTWAAAQDPEWKTIVSAARTRVNNIPSIVGSIEDKLDDPKQIAEFFLNMKAARARSTLDLDKTRYEYAQNRENRDAVPNKIENVNKIMDANVLDSLVMFGRIKRNPNALGEEWKILAALFHSEACASGTTADVSYGIARAFSIFFLGETSLRWLWLFRIISTHNQGRGWNHQNNPLECLRLLQPLLEDFKDRLTKEHEAKEVELALRLVYYPAILTLAEALKDCHRKPEAVFWLRRAESYNPSKYWKSRLFAELKNLGEYGDSDSGNEDIPPKLTNQKKEFAYIKNERNISEGMQPEHLISSIGEWAEALGWKIRWHETDCVNLPGTIRGAAQSIKTISTSLKERLRGSENSNVPKSTIKDCLVIIERALKTIQEAISNSKTKSPALQFLSTDNGSIEPRLSLREGITAWNALRWLLPALQATIALSEDLNEKSDLEVWRDTLKDRLEKWKGMQFADGERFAEVVSDQLIYELVQNPVKICRGNRENHRNKGCKHDLYCAEQILRGESNDLVSSTMYLLRRISKTDSEFVRFLKEPSTELGHKNNPVTPLTEFISLRRWNSFSPNLASRTTTTVGGGYLVRVWNENQREYVGIAIDPGYNFLENLFDEGFTLPDLNIIVITHAHPDHVENLSNILTLLRERKKRIPTVSRIFLILTEGVFQRFKTLIDDHIDFIENVIVLSWSSRPYQNTVCVRNAAGNRAIPLSLDIMDESDPLRPFLVSIKTVPAIHNDGTDFDSMGVIIHVPDRARNLDLRIGFTGDTRYTQDLCEKAGFENCNVLIPHLGSVIKNEAFEGSHESCRLDDQDIQLNKAITQLQSTLTKKNHLYLPGIAMLLCDLAKRKSKGLILLSEFGEELRGGLRAELTSRLQALFEMRVIPADVGLRVGVEERSVRCAICLQYVKADRIKPVAAADGDEALVFVCDDCHKNRQHELPILIGQLRKANHMPEVHPSTNRGSNSGMNPPAADLQPPMHS